MRDVIVVSGKVHGIYDEVLVGHQNRARVWQLKRMQSTGRVWAVDFFGNGMGEVVEPQWKDLIKHPAVYFRGTDLGPHGDQFEEIHLNLNRLRPKTE